MEWKEIAMPQIERIFISEKNNSSFLTSKYIWFHKYFNVQAMDNQIYNVSWKSKLYLICYIKVHIE